MQLSLAAQALGLNKGCASPQQNKPTAATIARVVQCSQDKE
jgi:hypothetical protein